MNSSALIAAFVEKVNATPQCFPEYGYLFPDELENTFISRSEESRGVLVEDIEERLLCRLPRSFRSLLCQYTFPLFDVSGMTFFAWSDNPKYRNYNLATALFEPNSLSPLLLRHGYVQIGRPETGSYDGICFDTNRKMNNYEYSIVRVEHERLMLKDKIDIVEEIAPSFLELMKTFVER